MEFRILGPLEVVDGGTAVPLGGPKQRSLLALLLLHAGEAVSNDRIAEAVWGEDAPRTALASIQNSVSQLRKLVGTDRLVTRSPGYELRLVDDELDVVRVRRLVEQARGASTDEGAELLREAESLWRGPPLADFAYDDFAQTAIAQLEELRFAVTEERIARELELGRHDELIAELEALVASHPLRERLRGHLMLALYRAGRQADALQSYEQARRLLVDELGIGPGPALQQLHSSILRQERALDRSPPRPAVQAEPKDVAHALLAGRLVPVLGSDAADVARRLADRFEVPADDERLTKVAQYVALMKGAGPLYDELHDLLATTGQPTPVHRFFASVAGLLRERGAPHQLLVTTSYDLALEQAFLEAEEEFDVVSYLSAGRHRGSFCHFGPDGSVRVIDVPNRYAKELAPERRTVILKLHGGVDRAHERAWESFVVTEDDYIDYMGAADLARAVPVSLAARLRRSHFLFLGYAMADWNLRIVLSRLWGRASVDYRSWAVTADADPVERALWRSRDVDLVEAPVEEYVEALARHVGLGAEVLR